MTSQHILEASGASWTVSLIVILVADLQSLVPPGLQLGIAVAAKRRYPALLRFCFRLAPCFFWVSLRFMPIVCISLHLSCHTITNNTNLHVPYGFLAFIRVHFLAGCQGEKWNWMTDLLMTLMAFHIYFLLHVQKIAIWLGLHRRSGYQKGYPAQRQNIDYVYFLPSCSLVPDAGCVRDVMIFD
jgi:hypothetical protein